MINKSEVIRCLDLALGMEEELKGLLERCIHELDPSSELGQEMAHYVGITEQRRELIRHRMEELGGTVSGAKPGLVSKLPDLESLGTGFSEERSVNQLLKLYIYEHLKVAFYKGLMAEGKMVLEPGVVDLCHHSLMEAQEFARSLEESLSNVLFSALCKQTVPAEAGVVEEKE